MFSPYKPTSTVSLCFHVIHPNESFPVQITTGRSLDLGFRPHTTSGEKDKEKTKKDTTKSERSRISEEGVPSLTPRSLTTESIVSILFRNVSRHKTLRPFTKLTVFNPRTRYLH